jgi:hypothetical protein
MGDLVSKVLAGGLSAGVFLLWWPSVVPAEGNEWLFVRGLLWTLAFEVLLLAFRPVERTVGRAVREREARTVAPRRLAPLLAVAAVAAAVPLAMLAGARHRWPLRPAPRRPASSSSARSCAARSSCAA